MKNRDDETLNQMRDAYGLGLRHCFVADRNSSRVTWHHVPKDYAHAIGTRDYQGSKIPNHIPKIEFCMNKLGPREVTSRLKKFLSVNGYSEFSKMLGNTNFAPMYRDWLAELTKEALKVEESGQLCL